MAGANPRQQFSVDKWVGKWFKSIQKLVMFWKQSEDFKDSFRTETSTILPRPCLNLNHTGHTYRNCP